MTKITKFVDDRIVTHVEEVKMDFEGGINATKITSIIATNAQMGGKLISMVPISRDTNGKTTHLILVFQY